MDQRTQTDEYNMMLHIATYIDIFSNKNHTKFIKHSIISVTTPLSGLNNIKLLISSVKLHSTIIMESANCYSPVRIIVSYRQVYQF